MSKGFIKSALLISTLIFTGFLFLGIATAQEIPGLELPQLPGTVEGTGTHFTVTDSSYLNLTLDSIESIKLRMESAPEMVTMFIESTSSTTLTQITLTGFSPNTTYYKYEDNYHNLTAFTTDASGSYSYTQDLSQLHLVFIQPRASTKFIKDDATGGDCASIGIWNQLTKTCTLTQNINQTIQIDNNGVTLDGNNYKIASTAASGSGIYVSGKNSVTLKNLTIDNFYYSVSLYSVYNSTIQNISAVKTIKWGEGLSMWYSDNNTITDSTFSSNNNYGMTLSYSDYNQITGNTASNNDSGIYLGDQSSYNTVTNNTFGPGNSNGIYLAIVNNNTVSSNNSFSNDWGIYIYNSSNNTLSGNTLSNNTYNFFLSGTVPSTYNQDLAGPYFNNNIDTSNLLDGKHLYYVKDVSNQVFDSSLNIGTLYCVRCSGVTVRGLSLKNSGAGIYFWNTQNSVVENVNISDSSTGIYYNYSRNNTITNNVISRSQSSDILLLYSDNNILSDNVTSGASYGVALSFANGNTVTRNSVSSNRYGVYLYNTSSNNQIYQNDFIDNSIYQVYLAGTSVGNIFNQPTPTGGNYWSNYDTPLEGCNNTNGDNFCDAPYVFTGGQDNLPWVRQDGWAVEQETPLYTQVRSPYPSFEETESWLGLDYADGGIGTYPCAKNSRATIARCGCAITSAVMVARFPLYGVTEAQGQDVNPGTINQWLKNEPGGYQNGDVNWIAVAKYADWRIKYEKTDTTPNNFALLDQKLSNSQPVIAKENEGRGGVSLGHFMVIDGKRTDGSYRVKDPAWYNTQRLTETTDTPNHIRGYDGGFDGLRIFKKGDGIAQSSITFALGSPAELLVTDPLGRKLGKDAAGIEYNEIPDAWYFQDGFDDPTGENLSAQERNKLIQILEPLNGEYKLETIGTGDGAYTLQTSAYDVEGQSFSQIQTGNTEVGLSIGYDITYDSQQAANITVAPEDIETPVISHALLNQEYILNSASVPFDFSAQDSGVGVYSVSAALDGNPMDSGQSLHFDSSQLGPHTIEIRAEDYVGNISTETISFSVIYQFSGFLSPIKADGSGLYRLNRTLPTKFQLSDVSNQYISTAVAQLFVAKLQDGIVGTDEVTLSTSNTDTGNTFRYDAENNQYIYNLATGALSVGSWQLKVVLDDTRYYTVVISLQ